MQSEPPQLLCTGRILFQEENCSAFRRMVHTRIQTNPPHELESWKQSFRGTRTVFRVKQASKHKCIYTTLAPTLLLLKSLIKLAMSKKKKKKLLVKALEFNSHRQKWLLPPLPLPEHDCNSSVFVQEKKSHNHHYFKTVATVVF